ncbi:UPF0489 family protein [Chryseobacterium sp. JM1]|uniref:UPF0489 family protein n=1 Tax=Chryseobacterium sp. JM1 TaxID=1233950 RepID=UPI0004E6BA92|nr:UPF0489 family protein [Chryseobacterium sp. JM1]KFF18838.1 hypothetical protein IW22_16650 [Chryseobacterium sp. JM1]
MESVFNYKDNLRIRQKQILKMKRFQRNDEYLTPPGSLSQLLSHPINKGQNGIDISIFNDHRYAFFFWNKWTQNLIKEDRINYPPCLVTLDWHQDLVCPEDLEKKYLEKLDLNSNQDVAVYAWNNLSSINDTHIMSAAYLNIIGDVYVHCRQGSFDSDWEDDHIIDRYGNTHTIKKFKDYKDLENGLLASDENNVYFDIDLDFFTLQNPFNGEGPIYTYLSEKTIKEMLDHKHPLMQWIFKRLQGITIAIEPEHSGGLLKANRLLNVINNIWFKPSLFTSYPGQWDKETNWKHLR